MIVLIIVPIGLISYLPFSFFFIDEHAVVDNTSIITILTCFSFNIISFIVCQQ